MSATITVICPEIEDSIEIYVDPEEKIEDIIERCQEYWQLEEEDSDHALMKRKNKLVSDKTVISSDLQDNDVVKLRKEKTVKETDKIKEKNIDLNPEEILSLAERWLDNNIGVNSEQLKLLERQSGDDSTNLLFKNTELDERYTVVVKGGKIKTYIPS